MAVLALSAVAMVSCDGGKDVEYVAGGQSDGAYFVSTATSYSLSEDATTFSIKIARSNADAASTVNLTATEPSGLLSIPTEVTFADGALTTELVIGYDIENFKYDHKYDVQLAIENPNIYGNGNYSFSVMRPSPFQPLGKGIYTDGIMVGLYNIDQLTYYVEVEESLTTPGIYRLKNPYAVNVFPYTEEGDMISNDPYYMIVNASDPERVYVEEFATNMIWDPDLGEMSFASYAYYFLINGNDPDLIAANGYFGTDKDGVITMPNGAKGFIWKGSTSEYSSWRTMSQASGWRLVLPGVDISDYSASVTYKGRFTNPDEETSLVADIEIGADVEYALVAASTMKDAAALQKAIANGEIESIKLTESGTVNIPVSEGGIYTIMVVTFANNEIQDVASTTVEVAIGGSEWETIGDAIILDGWMIGGSATYADEYEKFLLQCPVQQSTRRTGIYRLIQPYGPESVLGNFAEPGIYNIEVNAEDPTNVFIEPQSTGNGFFADGVASIATSGYFTDLEPDMRGTLEDDLIMFPATTCLLSFNGEDWYRTRKEGGILIERAATQAKSHKAIKTGNKITNSNGVTNAVPFNSSHMLRRTVKFETRVD